MSCRPDQRRNRGFHDWPFTPGHRMRDVKRLRDDDWDTPDVRDGAEEDRQHVRHNQTVRKLHRALGVHHWTPGRPEYRPDLAWLILASVDGVMSGWAALARVRVDRLERAADAALLAVEDTAGCE